MKKKIIIGLALLATLPAAAQWGNMGNRVKNQVINKTQDKILDETNNAYDKTYDKTKEGVKNSGKEKNSSSGDNTDSGSNNSNSNSGSSEKNTTTSSSTSSASFKTYGKFDFVPGEKVIAVEDFSQDALGDFPAKWNTNGTGELVNVEGQTGKWLKFGPESVIYPEFVNGLPENFTLEFNLATTNDYSYYSSHFVTIVAQLGSVLKEYPNWKKYGKKKNGLEFGVHPQGPGGKGGAGMKYYRVFGSSDNEELIANDASQTVFTVNKNIVKVSVWRQKTRLRIYVNEEKIWDVPKAFDPAVKYNFIGFRVEDLGKDDAYYLANIRLAVGAPDTRNKFIEQGKYSTTGIKFDVNSDKIKPESYGTLKDFATVLQENPEVRVKIVGHTDSDGDDASNLSLSKKRSESVKKALQSEFGIDAARMETDGKGETQPADNNTTPEGKANNRRVEFIKL